MMNGDMTARMHPSKGGLSPRRRTRTGFTVAPHLRVNTLPNQVLLSDRRNQK